METKSITASKLEGSQYTDHVDTGVQMKRTPVSISCGYYRPHHIDQVVDEQSPTCRSGAIVCWKCVFGIQKWCHNTCLLKLSVIILLGLLLDPTSFLVNWFGTSTLRKASHLVISRRLRHPKEGRWSLSQSFSGVRYSLAEPNRKYRQNWETLTFHRVEECKLDKLNKRTDNIGDMSLSLCCERHLSNIEA